MINEKEKLAAIKIVKDSLKNKELWHKTEINKINDYWGLYLLYDKNKELVYIGRATSIIWRLKQHLSKKPFEYFDYFPGDIYLLLENELIKELNPKYNGKNIDKNA